MYMCMCVYKYAHIESFAFCCLGFRLRRRTVAGRMRYTWGLFIYIYVYIYTYIYIHIHTYVNMYMYICTYIDVSPFFCRESIAVIEDFGGSHQERWGTCDTLGACWLRIFRAGVAMNAANVGASSERALTHRR